MSKFKKNDVVMIKRPPRSRWNNVTTLKQRQDAVGSVGVVTDLDYDYVCVDSLHLNGEGSFHDWSYHPDDLEKICKL